MNIREHALSLKGVTSDYKDEWGWDRYLIDDKIFLAEIVLKDRKAITLKALPEDGQSLRDEFKDVVIEGHYMNKVHWITIYLDQEMDEEHLKQLITDSYNLVVSKLSKKRQLEIQNM